RLDFRSRALRDALWGEAGALRKWLRPPFQLDGYRFDVANMVARAGPLQLHGEVWRELCAALETEHEPYLVGEHWFDPDELCWPGGPGVYYGDEIGRAGGDDPDNRRSMIWDAAQWDERAMAAVKGGIARRRASASMREGNLLGLGAGEHWAAFARASGREVS